MWNLRVAWISVRYLVLSIPFAGCLEHRGDDIPPLYPVHGVVTLDGEPLSGVTLSFLPEIGPSSGAITDGKGRYIIHHRSGKEGAVKGPTKVMIMTQKFEDNVEIPEFLPARYNTETELEIIVLEGDNEFNFELHSE